jgi:hypothetical protein
LYKSRRFPLSLGCRITFVHIGRRARGQD